MNYPYLSLSLGSGGNDYIAKKTRQVGVLLILSSFLSVSSLVLPEF